MSKEFVEYSIKDISLQKKVAKEFKHLCLDFGLLLLVILSLLMINRAKPLYSRLRGVY